MTKTSDNLDWFYEHGEPLPVQDGIKANSQSGAFTRNWWAKRWLQALVQLMDTGRLARGKQYARDGQVISLEIQEGLVLGQVQGTRPRPYRQRIEVREFTNAEWERALTGLASQALFAAQLLNGEMPQNIEEAFTGAELALFPATPSDLTMSCTCPDWARPCKHLAAILLLVGESLDGNPFLLFVMRGRNRDQIMTALRDHRAAVTAGVVTGSTNGSPEVVSEAPAEPTREEQAARFWRMGDEASGIQVRVARPEVEMESVKLLGDPAFTEDAALLDKLAEVYRRVTERAMQVAFAAHDEHESDNGTAETGATQENSDK